MRNLLTILFDAFVEIVRRLAEIEFILYGGRHNKPQPLRRFQFRLMGVSIKGKAFIGNGTYIRCRKNLFLGDRCSLGGFIKIWNYAPVHIGADFLAAPNVVINAGTHDILTLEPGATEIRIGDRVWVGANCTILAGVTIGDDVVIAAGSLVNKDVPSNSIVAGVPARWIRSIDRSNIKIWTPFT